MNIPHQFKHVGKGSDSLSYSIDSKVCLVDNSNICNIYNQRN